MIPAQDISPSTHYEIFTDIVSTTIKKFSFYISFFLIPVYFYT